MSTTRQDLENREMVALNLCVHALRNLLSEVPYENGTDARRSLKQLGIARRQLAQLDRYGEVKDDGVQSSG